MYGIPSVNISDLTASGLITGGRSQELLIHPEAFAQWLSTRTTRERAESPRREVSRKPESTPTAKCATADRLRRELEQRRQKWAHDDARRAGSVLVVEGDDDGSILVVCEQALAAMKQSRNG